MTTIIGLICLALVALLQFWRATRWRTRALQAEAEIERLRGVAADYAALLGEWGRKAQELKP